MAGRHDRDHVARIFLIFDAVLNQALQVEKPVVVMLIVKCLENALLPQCLSEEVLWLELLLMVRMHGGLHLFQVKWEFHAEFAILNATREEFGTAVKTWSCQCTRLKVEVFVEYLLHLSNVCKVPL